MNISLSGKNILITGGTGTLGSVLVTRALEEGARVFFAYHRNEEKAKALADKGAVPLQFDITDRTAVDWLKDKLKENCGNLDALVHCAGIVRDHTLQNLTADDWDKVIAVNLTAVYYLTRKLLPLLYKKENSRIIFIASRVGLQGGFGEANYAASKAGLIALTKTLAAEVGRQGILVNAVTPGFMLSKMNEGLSDDVKEKNRKESYLGSFSDPNEVADFMIYLLSDKVSKLTGQVFHYDSRKI